MKKTAVFEKRELKFTYGLDIALCVLNFLICTVLCAGGSPWLNIAGVIAFIMALVPVAAKRMYYKDEQVPASVGAVTSVLRAAQIMLLMFGTDYFLIA